MTVAVWLGGAAPLRSIRWLDGALAAAARLGQATAIAAGDPTWLDLAADRASREGLASLGVPLDQQLDYLGWAQLVAAAARHVGARTVLVDQASRPERLPEVAAIAEQLAAAQLTHVTALAADGDAVHATRVCGAELQSVRIRGDAVLGVRIAGPVIEEYPTPTPSASMVRIDVAALGLDAAALGRRALTPRANVQPRRNLERVAQHLAMHLAPRRGG